MSVRTAPRLNNPYQRAILNSPTPLSPKTSKFQKVNLGSYSG